MVGSTVNGVKMVPGKGRGEWIELGRVAGPHGLDGNLLVDLYGEDPDNLLCAEAVTLTGEPGTILFRVQGARAMGNPRGGQARVCLVLAGLESRDRAEVWTGAMLSIPRRALQPLPEGEFYWRDILGLRCRLRDGRDLGVVEEIWPTGSNDVLVIRDGTRTRLVPALRSVLVRVDSGAGELWVDPPAGLLEED